MRSAAAIQQEIHAAERCLIGLRRELEHARRREAMQAVSQKRRADTAQEVWRRLASGWWVSGVGGRLWWHTPAETLRERATADEIEVLEDLSRHGVVETGEVTR